MSLEEARELLQKDSNFIYSKRFDFSLQKLLERYPDGAPNKVIAQVLLITEEEVENIVNKAIIQIRQKMKITLD
jgi:hypothetical protein